MKLKLFQSIIQTLTGLTLLLILFVINLLLLTGCGSASQSQPAPADSGGSESTQAGVAGLAPAERADHYQAKPAMAIDPQKSYRATIQTSKGDIVVSLDATASPEHVNNFIFLSNDGFYDGLTFHRVEPGFVIQGGDPLGMGNGGPGYTVPGEFQLKHIEGALAMARQGDSVNPKRESSGSQFYITLAPTPFLDETYSVFGKVEQGMDVVKAIQVGDTIKGIVIEIYEINEFQSRFTYQLTKKCLA